MKTLAISTLVVILAVSPAHAQKKKPKKIFRSVTANSGYTRYLRSYARANLRHQKVVTEARALFVRSLHSAMRYATKSGDLKEANKLNAAIDLFESGALPFGGGIGPPQEVQQLVGKWKMKKAGKAATSFIRFAKDGRVVISFDGDKRTYRGKIIKRGDALFVDLGDRDTNRLSVVGDRLFIEHWRGPMRKGFADDVQSGYRVK
ncbi:MAG: hypothetical protein IID45_08645 [Planctomycetes bacterium]|nr:hypothetical protein [Planctomycetota bacterium]